jgi:hypothetical protein
VDFDPTPPDWKISSYGHVCDPSPSARHSMVGKGSYQGDLINIPFTLKNSINAPCPLVAALKPQMEFRLTPLSGVGNDREDVHISIEPVDESKGEYVAKYRPPGWSHRVGVFFAGTELTNSPATIRVKLNEVGGIFFSDPDSFGRNKRGSSFIKLAVGRSKHFPPWNNLRKVMSWRWDFVP